MADEFDALLAESDAELIDLLGSSATYAAPGLGPVPVTALLERDVQVFDSEGVVQGYQTRISIADRTLTLKKGGMFRIGSADYKLQELVEDDGSLRTWSVTTDWRG